MSIQILAKDSIKFYDMPTKLINEHLQIYQGGFGSDATGDPSNNKRFYALTDRGPNLSGKEKGSKIFPIPDYTPSIGYFEITQDNSINLLKLIELKTPAGKNLTGLPNPEGLGAIDEVALDMMGNSLGTDKYGIDSEGLVVAQDGTFWIADEYGPHLIHFNGEGIELERISPYGVNTGKRKLPAVFAQRRANRGMEGLTMTPDQSSLVGIMQSTLFNPTKQEAINRTLTRIIMFDLKSGETKQFLYKQNADNFSNSSIIALSNSQFLVGERDGKFASEGTEVQKHVYLIDITNATDVSGDVKSKTGMLLNGKALEQLSWDELEKVGINAVEKKLVLDLVKENGYPHDKFEGMWLIDQHHLAVINDDDFGIASDKGNMVHKMLPNTTIRDHSRVYIYPISLD
ncbi:esterase-like activity of phytase family protein [Pasteurellaceae bacterium NCTC 11878]|nr:esterase-like activity of phytase family protein [Spirabiliibacterium falconis]